MLWLLQVLIVQKKTKKIKDFVLRINFQGLASGVHETVKLNKSIEKIHDDHHLI